MTPAENLDPPWLAIARRDIGNPENLGPNDSPYLRKLLARMNVAWLKGQPWCGISLAGWMQQAGQQYPKAYYRAKAWADWGVPVSEPCLGAVVVFDREGGGHVGLCVGYDKATGNLLVLGGNQNDMVRVSAFNLSKRPALAYRMPDPRFPRIPLPWIDANAATSTSEA
jgi:uncharacterized protein (TIGR02594 family)